MANARAGLRPDPFTMAIAITVVVASLLPCRGSTASALSVVTDVFIALLFFLHGARLSRETVLTGVRHYRLHLVVLCSTFVMFPLLGLVLDPLSSRLLSPELQAGLWFLCAVPSTVQSSIAFTALARGNVAAAVCSASASSLLGVLLTPALVELMGLRASGSVPLTDAVLGVALQLLAPFILGQLLRSRLLGFVTRHGAKLKLVDQGSILLVVYGAFSAAMVQGLWQRLPPSSLLALALIVSLLLGAALFITLRVGRRLELSREDRIVVLFCGSKKSLASGVPIANVLFPAAAVGAMVLPLMLYHQLQLMVCAVLAQRYARDGAEDEVPLPVT
jgi:solute carrier family 10 (sodium/bile acid cotransporter), member 7